MMSETFMILKTCVFSTEINPVFLNTAKGKQKDNKKYVVIITKKKRRTRKGFCKPLFLCPAINCSFSLQATLKCKLENF